MSYTLKAVPNEPEQLQRFLTEELTIIGNLLQADTKYTQEQLADKGSVINTRLKQEGLRIWDTTNKRPVWSTGKNPEDVWITGADTIAHSPV